MITIIESKKKLSLGLRELIGYRELVLALALRDFRIRYSQALLGLVWAFIQPVLTLLVFYIVFGKFAKVDTGPVPYLLFITVGMSVWGFFSFVVSQAGTSIIGAQNLVTKVYFPRLVIPVSKSIVGFIDLAIGLLLTLLLFIVYRFPVSSSLLALPGVLLLVIIFSLSVGIWISALTIRFRDVQYIIPFLIQIGLYATPIAYPVSIIPPQWQWIAWANPMAAFMELIRWSLLGTAFPGEMQIISAIGITFVLLLSGLLYFKSVESKIADII